MPKHQRESRRTLSNTTRTCNNLLDETPQLSPKVLRSPPETTPDMGGVDWGLKVLTIVSVAISMAWQVADAEPPRVQ